MRGKPITCCLTGHRPSKLPWGNNESDPRCVTLKEKLRAAIQGAYEEGFRHFICGMAQGCDLYFCELALQLREKYGDVSVEAAVPCPTQADGWSREERQRWQRLIDQCDVETMVQDHYTPDCMLRRNRYMVDHASLLIAVYDGQNGGTRRTMEYAMRRGLDIVDISPVG